MAYFRGSSDALAKDATWISQVGLRDRHDTVTGTVYSDVAGTLHIEQSIDGTFDNDGSGKVDFDTSVSVSAATGTTFSVALSAPYWRLRYLNGGTKQTKFRIAATTQAGGDS